MNVQDLIDRLQDCDPDAEVLLAHQPSWPLQFRVAGVATNEDIGANVECDEQCQSNCTRDTDAVVYLVEGGHPAQPYAPHAVWEVAS